MKALAKRVAIARKAALARWGKSGRPGYQIPDAEIVVPGVQILNHWPRAYGLVVIGKVRIKTRNPYHLTVRPAIRVTRTCVRDPAIEGFEMAKIAIHSVAEVETDSTHPPPGLFTKGA